MRLRATLLSAIAHAARLFVGLPLDSLSAAAAYSTRKLRTDYTGPALRVRRSLDNAEADIGFSGTDLDTTALMNFVGYQNLLTYSEEFDNAAWTKLRMTVAVNQIANPLNGAVDADKAIPANDSLSNLLHQNYTLTSGVTYTYSMYVKSAGYDFIQLASSTGFAFGDYVNFNLSTGTVASNNMSASDYGIESVGDGWYRIHMTQVANISGSGRFITLPMSVDVASRAGANTTNGIDGVYVWGGQVNQGATAQTYSPTSRRNLLTFTEEFDDSAWLKVNVSITGNTAIAPNNTQTADTISSLAGTSGKYFSQYFTSISGSTYTYSMYAKQDTGRYLQITPVGGGIFPITAQTYVNFDLQTGTVSSAGTDFVPADYSITDEGNGWYRISLTVTATSSSALARFLIISLNTGLETRLTSSSGTPSYGVFGGQVEESSTPTEYQRVNASWSATRDGNGFDTTWYDQSGNGRNLTQATAGSQPSIVTNGVINTVNGKPAIQADGVNDVLSSAGFINSVLLNSPMTFNYVHAGTNSSFGWSGNGINGAGGNPRLYFLPSGLSYSALNVPGVTPILGPQILGFTHDGVNSTSVRRNGVQLATGTQAVETVGFPIGGHLSVPFQAGGTFQAGLVTEGILFAAALSTADQQALERSQGDYFGITVS